jgi:hypothetical protein
MSRTPRYPLRETVPVNKPADEVEDWYARQSAFEMLDRLAQTIVQPGAPVDREAARQSVLLLAGDHAGFRADATVWRVAGAPGAVIKNRVVVATGVVIFDGVTFQASTSFDNSGAMVEVRDGATAIFNGCHFLRDSKKKGVVVDIDSGGKAHFNGCLMEPANTSTTFAIDNAGLAANVYVQGSVNLTGAAHNNVTTISETT